MDREYFRHLLSTGMILVLLVLSFFLLRPILLAIFLALILAFLFYPLQKRLRKRLKSSNLSAFLICIILALIIFLPIWFLAPILIKQSIDFYFITQEINFVTPLKNIFPSIFASDVFAQEAGSAIHSFVTKISNSLMNAFATLIRDFPVLLLQFLVVIFVFFVTLKDQEKFSDYIRSLLPFPKDVEDKLFESSKGITSTVVYGQIVLGIFQGLLIGASFYIFGIENALFFTILACIAGIFPIIGTSIVWIPSAIYLLAVNSIWPAIGVSIAGIFASSIDSFVKPVIISKWVNLHPAIILVGMVGGLFVFGILGVVLGPLILAYLLIVLDIYRDKRIPGVFLQGPEINKK